MNNRISPKLMHIELTDRCPLDCPQCYSKINDGFDLSINEVKKLINDGKDCGIKIVAFSGGEPLIYKSLDKAIETANRLDMYTILSTSGYQLTDKRIIELEDSGLNEIYLSLNGSSPEIHNQSRDAFHVTYDALQRLRKHKLKYAINWVARKENIADFKNVVKLARVNNAHHITVLVLKPDRSHSLVSAPSQQDLMDLGEYIKDEKTMTIHIESCFSGLHQYVHGGKSGCKAGKGLIAVDVKGRFNPCRHLNFSEEAASVSTYLKDSIRLRKIANNQVYMSDNCKDCLVVDTCSDCKAVLFKGQKRHESCIFENNFRIVNQIKNCNFSFKK